MKAKFLITLAVLAAAGYGAYSYFSKPTTLTYVKAAVTRGPVESVIAATGTLSATRLVPVGSRVSGNVVKMYADFNTQVRAGQLLAEIDPSTFQTTLEQRRASLRSAETQIKQAEVAEKRADVDVRNAETNILNQKAAVARAKSQMDSAKRKYDQQKGLGDVTSRDAIDSAREAWEQSVLSLESAQSQIATAEANLESVKAQREVTATQKITAQSQITQAQGQVQEAELQLSFTRITAPVDGVVISRSANEGETVQASMTAPQLYSIAEDLTSMHLDTNIDESDISRVQLEQEATFTVDAFPGQTFRGEVIQIRRGAVNVQNVISYTVVIDVANPDGRLFPGMTANTRIVVERVESTLRVPSAALRFRPPADFTVVGDVGKGKGGFTKDAAPAAPEPLKEVSKAEAPKATTPAKNDVTAENSGKGGRRNGGKGGGNFDPSQFKGKDGSFDREALRAQFQGKGGGNFDPSQFRGKGGGGFARGGGGRGAGGVGTVAQTQTVHRLNAKGELEAVRIRTGMSDGNWIQLLSTNLAEGDELVTVIEGLPTAPTKAGGNNNNNNFKNNGGFPGGGRPF